jgi:hypothetical protein
MPSHGFTLLGLPTVTATIKTNGVWGQLDSRLYDVLPDGSERLVSRGAYRLLDNQTGQITFQLHGNGYTFPSGDMVKLELRGNDADYLRPSNNPAFTVQVSGVTVSLPVPAGTLRVSVQPTRVKAHARKAFRFVVTTSVNGSTIQIAGAQVRLLGHSAQTGSGGAAKLSLALPHSGAFKATVSKIGFRPVTVTVHATKAAAARPRTRARPPTTPPRFTG